MHFKKIYLLIFIATSLFSDARIKYLQKDADIEFIGKKSGYEKITVPKEIVEYEPILRDIENTILYTEREVEKAACVIDHLNHEYCPIDKIECSDEHDYETGTSKKRHKVKKADPFCTGTDLEGLNQNDAGITYLECFKDADNNGVKDRAARSNPSIGDFTAMDTVAGQGWWDRNIIPGSVVQRKNPDSPTFFVYSPTFTDRDNMIIEGDLSMNTNLATEYKGDNDWIGFVFGFKDTKNYYYLSWRRNSTIGKTGSNLWTGFTLGKVVNGTLPWNHEDGNGNTKLQRNTSEDVYGWEDGGKYKIKIVYNKFFIKAYIAKYDSAGNVGPYLKVIDYNPEEYMNITGKMGFMNHSNGGAVYGGFTADYCATGYAVDGDTYQCKREPDCENYYKKIRLGDVGVIRCEMEYDYYDYLCPDEPNIYGNNYFPLDPGGDCGHVLCTNGPTPPTNNCVRLKYSCPVDPSKTCVLEEKEMDITEDIEVVRQTFDNPPSGWSVSNITNLDILGSFFGRFGGSGGVENVSKTFSMGIENAGQRVTIDADLIKIDSWDNGEGIKVFINGSEKATFNRDTMISGVGVGNVSYKDNGGWIEKDVGNSHSHEFVKHISLSAILDDQGNIKLGFGSTLNQSIADESWGLDNLVITLHFDGNRTEFREHTYKKPLAVPTVEGEYNGLEFGNIKGYPCEENCKYSLSRMYAKDGHTLCLEGRTGVEGCFQFSDDCSLNGNIEEVLPGNKAIFYFLNSASEDIPEYNNFITEEHNTSPTGISLLFHPSAQSTYPLGKLEHVSNDGDKLTVNFWMKWDGKSEGAVFSFGDYGLWISSVERSKHVFGFNNYDGNIQGFYIDGLKNGWHRVTAIFTQGDISENKIYIDGVLQDLQEYTTNGVVPLRNLTPNMNSPMHLSGSGSDNDGMYSGELAGINIFDGELTSDAILRMHNQGYYTGISYIQVNQNSIEGFDTGGTSLGTIESSCKLSGKVGDFGQVVEIKEEMDITEDIEVVRQTFDNPPSGWSVSNITNLDILGSFFGRFGGSGGVENVSKTFSMGIENAGQRVTIDADLIKIDSWDNGEGIKVFINGSEKATFNRDTMISGVGVGNVSYKDNGGWIEKDVGNSHSHEFVKHISLSAILDDQGNIKLGFGSTLNQSIADESWGLDNLVITLHFDGNRTEFREHIVSHPIVAAKATNNRIEFWDSFTRGPIGFIEPLKYVKDADYSEGYRHEFADFDKLYELGFTSFVTSSANITYAISNNPMDTASCLEHIKNTQYFLSDRDLNDEVEMSTLKALTPYLGGEFGEFCVIEKNGAFSNSTAEFAIKNLVKEGVYTTFVCSPWSCESHNCGVASCKEHFVGTIVKPKDRDMVLNSTICLEQRCDINNDYFSVCGNKTGCPDTAGVYQTENGKCVKAECNNGGSLNTQSGMCEKLGCKNSIDAGDGTCYKKL